METIEVIVSNITIKCPSCKYMFKESYNFIRVLAQHDDTGLIHCPRCRAEINVKLKAAMKGYYITNDYKPCTPKERVGLIRRLYQEGCSREYICKAVGCSQSTIQKYV